MLSLDVSTPALLVKFGHYPLHHGGVSVLRTLGRLGVPAYAITESAATPAAVSRYLTKAFVWPTTGAEDPEKLLAGLVRIGRRIGRPTVLVPTDERAAILIAEHDAELAPYFLSPKAPPGLVRRLASKQGLHQLCQQHDVPTPATSFPASYRAIEEFAATARFPIVVKNRDTHTRTARLAVRATTLVESAAELLALAVDWGEQPHVVLQEYIPRHEAEDWMVNLHLGAESGARLLMTAVKVRSWPPQAGVTACAQLVPNTQLAELSADFCKRIGFHGIADLDWRYDRRDGVYKLVDFNPRVGAQFRLFETEAGVDVVRALHLELTGRKIPESPQLNGRRLIVEHVDPRARAAVRRLGYTSPSAPDHAVETDWGWWAKDDVKPVLAMLGWSVRPGVRYLAGQVRERARR
jgi:predicted ATP-grasp superfamily ATP-dependent carboligase